MLNGMTRWLALGALLLGVVPLVVRTSSAAVRPLHPWEFADVAEPGFGERQNSGAWSMQWWGGKLYVGTVRAFFCWSQAALHRDFPQLVPYPPSDPDMDCTPGPQDLPLQAEIWRYTPEADTWERVYQSPQNVPIPDKPGKYTARDVGFRSMAVFEEPDGTEALYVSGVYPHVINPDAPPPPRILRSTDGITFEAIPQDPGTLMGDFDKPSFRGMVTYENRMYLVAGTIQGDGAVWQAENPAGGNDNFRQVTPPEISVFELMAYNGYLYVGTNTQAAPEFPESSLEHLSNTGSLARTGYSVMKTDATGTPPYTFIPVVTDGGYLTKRPSQSVVSMHVFQGRLYVGTDSPAELIRINPDDTWDLIVGEPRETPDGWKYPLSGMDAGFDWPLTAHMWRMQEHEGVLYVGTADNSTRIRRVPGMEEQLGDRLGFDLYRTSDGSYFTPITLSGFGDKFQMGVRTFASTPYGLFVGTVSFWYGLRIWQGIPGELYTLYLPVIYRSPQSSSAVQGVGRSPSVVQVPNRRTGFLQPPQRLEAENIDGAVVLSWERPRGATRFHILRSDSTCNRELQIPDLDPDAWIPGQFTEIAVTDQFYFVDASVQADKRYQYYVVAENGAGTISPPSNLVRAPSLAPAVTFGSLKNTVVDWASRGRFKTRSVMHELEVKLADASGLAEKGDMNGAVHRLEQVRQRVRQNQPAILDPWYAQDLEILLSKLARRVRLAQAGLLFPSDLD